MTIPRFSPIIGRVSVHPSTIVESLPPRTTPHRPAPGSARLPADALLRRARQLEQLLRADPRAIARLPLYGIPFAVKDNIDVAGMPTTAACPAFSYVPERSATAVERLEAAGAILVGKTNMDQFATGLVGTRSPYGAVPNAFRPEYISGGSSSGSAVTVARGTGELFARDRHGGFGPGAGRFQQYRRIETQSRTDQCTRRMCRRASRSTACRCLRSPCPTRSPYSTQHAVTIRPTPGRATLKVFAPASA